MAVLDLSIYRYLLLLLVVPVIVPCCSYRLIVLSSYRLIVLSTLVACRRSCLLVVIRFVSFVVDSIRFVCRCSQWPRLATVATLSGTPGDRPQGGGRFSDMGGPTPETRPVPIFTHEVKKNAVFQAQNRGKTGRI